EREAEGMVRRLMEENESQRVRLRDALERGDVLLAELEARQGDVVDAQRERQSVVTTADDLRRRLDEIASERDAVRHDLEFRLEARERELAEVRAAHASLEGDFRSARGTAETKAQELIDVR